MRLNAVLKTSPIGEESFASGTASTLNRRQSERKSLRLSTISRAPSAGEFPVLVRDISAGGLLIEAENGALLQDDVIILDLPGNQLVTARVVWTSGTYFGCEFDEMISLAVVSAALLKAGHHAANAPSTSAPQSPPSRDDRGRTWPELNFSLPFYVSLLLWGAIGVAICQLT